MQQKCATHDCYLLPIANGSGLYCPMCVSRNIHRFKINNSYDRNSLVQVFVNSGFKVWVEETKNNHMLGGSTFTVNVEELEDAKA